MPTLYSQVEKLTRLVLTDFGFQIPSDANTDTAKKIMTDAAQMGLLFELKRDKWNFRHYIFEATLRNKMVLKQDILTGT